MTTEGAGRHKVLKRSKEEQLTQPPARSLHKVEVITSKQNNGGGVFTLMCVCVCAVSQIGRHFFVQTLADVAPLGNLRSLSVL